MPRLLCFCLLSVTPQIISPIMPRRGQIVVISQVELLLNVRIPSILFLVAVPLICCILLLGASTTLQGHYWTVWIIRKFSLISNWNLPPYDHTQWILLCLLELQENESTSLSTCYPFKCLQESAMSVQSHLIRHQMVRHLPCHVAKGGWETAAWRVGRLTKILHVSFFILGCLEWLQPVLESCS